jgi:DNA polymerase-3 subunit delta
MKLGYDQLLPNLKRGLLPVYLIAGDETLLVQEASDAVKAAAQAAGFSERIQFSIETGFDWGLFKQAYQNTSLFSDKQCIELQMPSTKLTDMGKNSLTSYLERPCADKLLLIVTGKMDAGSQKNTWYKMLEKMGVVVTVYGLQPPQMAAWISQRLQKAGLQADAEGVQLLAAATQGNLLATAREIDKLALLYTNVKLSVEHVRTAIADSARYDVFNLADAVLQADHQQVVHIVQALKAEAAEPTLVLWALARDIRQLLQVQSAVSAGKALGQALNEQGVWEKRKPWMSQTLRRHSRESLYATLQQAANVDRMIKGAAVGYVWDELMKLALGVAGLPLLRV